MEPVESFLDVVVFLLFIAVASMANKCLLERDQRNRVVAAIFRGQQSRRDMSTRQAFRSAGSQVSSQRSLVLNGDDPLDEPDPVDDSRDDDEQYICCGRVEVRSLVFQDVRCLLFILIILSSLTQAIVSLILMLESYTIEVENLDQGKRKTQDLVVLVGPVSLYVTLVCLLLILSHLVDKEVGVEQSTKTINAWRFFAATLLVMISAVPFLIMVVLDVWIEALEVYSNIFEFSLACAFLVASQRLPGRVLSFGEELRSVAAKIRNVCLVAALCLAVRGALLLPPTQDALRSASAYAVPFLEFSGMVPLYAVMTLLHQSN
jgi:hypothetical protein